MTYCDFYKVSIGQVVICRIIRHIDNPSAATIISWERNIKFQGTNEQIVEFAKTMLPEVCHEFVTLTKEK